MRSIKAKKSEVLEKVKANRARHREIFEEAIVGYREMMLKQLESRIADLKAGRSVEHIIMLTAPTDHTADYDRVIAMLEMDVASEIELGETDFACYVMDDWQWRRDFLNNATSYGSASAARLD